MIQTDKIIFVVTVRLPRSREVNNYVLQYVGSDSLANGEGRLGKPPSPFASEYGSTYCKT